MSDGDHSASTRETRRLAAIVAADVVGFSRLVGADEEGTLQSLRAHRRDLIDPLIDEHGGRVANTAGDSLLIEFPSVVDAVRCTVAIQHGMDERNAGLPDDSRMILRMGINLGDVIAEGDDLLGDGVNIAARLEALCEPGGLAISDDAYRQVRDRLELTWVDAGEHEVKNIARPVRVWRWDTGRRTAPAVLGPASVDRPSIAVLPFDNMSGDPEQQYFSDGIAEDVITSLSKIRWLFVIARNSSFGYRGGDVPVARIGDELGVRYVLEGSVRRAGDRVRVTAQLVEARSGNHVWAERWDRRLDDVFEVQDDITTRIVTELDPAIRSFETHAALAKPPDSLQAWDHLLRGLWLRHQFRKQSRADARREFERALELDPNYARALAGLATCLIDDVMLGFTDDPTASLEAAGEAAQRALALDPDDPACHFTIAGWCFWTHRLEQGRRAAERAVELNPNSFHAHYILGGLLNYLGAPEASIRASELAIELSPNDPIAWHCLGSLAHAHYNLGEYEKTIEVAERAISIRHGYLFGRILRTAALGQLERSDEAAKSLAEILERRPDFSTDTFGFYPFEIDGQRDHLIDGLRQAGMVD